MDPIRLLNLFPLLALVTWAAVEDLRKGKIPNWLTVSLALSGLMASFVPGSAVGPGGSVLGLLAGFAPAFLLFAIGGLGAGDVKLLAGIGAWIGPGPILMVLALSAIVGAMLAVAQALWRGQLLTVFCGTLATAIDLTSQRGIGSALSSGGVRAAGPGQRLALALSIWIATLLVLFTPAARLWRGV